MNILPKYFFVKRQKNNVKGWEANYNKGSGWPESLGFFKTKKEAREEVEKHRQGEKNVSTNPM